MIDGTRARDLTPDEVSAEYEKHDKEWRDGFLKLDHNSGIYSPPTKNPPNLFLAPGWWWATISGPHVPILFWHHGVMDWRTLGRIGVYELKYAGLYHPSKLERIVHEPEFSLVYSEDLNFTAPEDCVIFFEQKDAKPPKLTANYLTTYGKVVHIKAGERYPVHNNSKERWVSAYLYEKTVPESDDASRLIGIDDRSPSYSIYEEHGKFVNQHTKK